MDSKGFQAYLTWWYTEVQKHSEGPWLLTMDNCGGHDLEHNLPDVKIEFLPPRSTAKYQPLDLGMIAHSKIRYRSILLRAVIDIVIARASTEATFPESSERGKWGLNDGHLPHVGDAITLFDEAWGTMSRCTVLKCWIKSSCLSPMQCSEAKQILQMLSSNGAPLTVSVTNQLSNDDLKLNLEPPISGADAEMVVRDLTSTRFLAQASSPINEIIQDAYPSCANNSMADTLNSPAPFDDDPPRENISSIVIQRLFNEDQGLESSTTDETLTHTLANDLTISFALHSFSYLTQESPSG